MNWKLVLVILTCNILFMSSSYTMLIPFLPMYLTMELGVSQADVNIWSGIVFSASFLVSAVMAPIWGKMADTKGKRIMAMRASFLLSISYFLGGIVQSPEQLTLMRLFQGFASGLWPMDLAIMTLYAPASRLGFCLGIMQGTLTAGGVVGPLLGGILAEAVGMRYSFFLASGALFLNFLVFTFIIKEPPTPAKTEATKDDIPDATECSPWRMPLLRNMLLCGTLVQMVILILQPVLTTYVAKLAGPLPNIVFVAGLVFSLGGIAGAMAAPVWGTFGQRHGFFKAMCLGMTGAGISMIIQGIPNTLVPFAIMQFVGGLFFCGIHPAINAILASNTPPSYKGRIFGMLFAAQQVGSMAGPLLGGLIATYLGMHWVFALSGIILLLLSTAVWRRYHAMPY
ncbi:MFS transporter [uncultured Mitsuokella sp.]|uniref:MFS transporter n=1 Tax=uncultured Mitsuokella sp. TaxID=453120 RepID=UPI002620AD6F|nr:MFS transporter [uncultured Mitsuokella sp.]